MLSVSQGPATAKFLLRLILRGRAVGVVEDDAGEDGDENCKSHLGPKADRSHIDLIELQEDHGDAHGQGKCNEVPSEVDGLTRFSCPFHVGSLARLSII